MHSHAQQPSLTLISISLSVWCLSVLRGTWASSPFQIQEFWAGTGQFHLTCVCEWMFVSVINLLHVQDLSRFLPRRQRGICPPPHSRPSKYNLFGGGMDGWMEGLMFVGEGKCDEPGSTAAPHTHSTTALQYRTTSAHFPPCRDICIQTYTLELHAL